MKLSEFVLLNEEEKKLAVLHRGILIAKRTCRHCMVFLFQLENFYVEMYCNFQKKVVEEYRAFTHTKPLAPYLDNISIDHLLK